MLRTIAGLEDITGGTLTIGGKLLNDVPLADRIVVLQAGRIEQLGSPMGLFEQAENIFVAGFSGSPGTNVIAAAVVVVEASATGAMLKLGGGEAVAVMSTRPPHACARRSRSVCAPSTCARAWSTTRCTPA